MNCLGAFSRKSMRVGMVGILLAGIGCVGFLHQGPARSATAPTQPTAIQPLSVDDVSWLFPPPTKAEDFAKLIAVRDLTTLNHQDPTKSDPVWPDSVFQRFLDIAASLDAEVDGTPSRIGLPTEAQKIDGWFVAGIRIDAGAPGLSSDIRSQFGQSPEIRLIVQPVTRNPDGTPKVDDIAAHLIFDFTLPPQAKPDAGCLPKPVPDFAAFSAIVSDLAELRTKLSNGQLGSDKVITANTPLGIHPGLADATTANNFRNEIISFLERHISGERLNAMAIAGLPAGAHAPWIFLSMLRVPAGVVPGLPQGGFVPVHGPTLDGKQFAQMLQPAGTVPRVVPVPHTNNLNPMTCVNAAVPGAILPDIKRSGVSTSDLANTPAMTDAQTKVLLDVISDPTKSHFFNTDCVSCHTETRRTMELLKVNDITGIDAAALPNGTWDVRNFGWAPAGKGVFQATVTRRTATETAAVVAYINSEMLATQRH